MLSCRSEGWLLVGIPNTRHLRANNMEIQLSLHLQQRAVKPPRYVRLVVSFVPLPVTISDRYPTSNVPKRRGARNKKLDNYNRVT
jgi:hypothetical protein